MRETNTHTLSPTEVAELIHTVARPHMAMDNYCTNAARITRDVLNAHGIKNWAVHASVAHMNAAYVEAADRLGFMLGDGEAEDRYGQELLEAGAWMVFLHVEEKGKAGFPGHVLTWVPEWGCYIDPSGGQADRPAKGIIVGPSAWACRPPPAHCGFERDDGGVTIIAPTDSKRFKNTSGYSRPSPPEILREILREWPV